jgi:hypothetical protein
MLYIGEPTLSFDEISKHWSREEHYSQDELLDELVRAWWRGEIRCKSGVTRLELLKRMFERMHDRDHPAIVFIVGQDTTRELDSRPRIPVPSRDASSWDEGACRDAFDALARQS